MIKFFRKIRQQFVMENKTSKYFKYAIGEIVLVIIGILFALQINNWNQDRISRIELNQSLDKLLVELNKDIVDLDDKIKLNSNFIEKLDSCLLILKEPKKFSVRDFDKVFHNINYTSTFTFNKVSFNEISNSGALKRLDNIVLSDSLINYYNESLFKIVEDGLKTHVRDNVRNYTLGFDYLHFNDSLETYQASDFGIQKKTLDDFRSDVRIVNAIRFKILLHRVCKNRYKSIIPKTKYLIQMIEKELKRNSYD